MRRARAVNLAPVRSTSASQSGRSSHRLANRTHPARGRSSRVPDRGHQAAGRPRPRRQPAAPDDNDDDYRDHAAEVASRLFALPSNCRVSPSEQHAPPSPQLATAGRARWITEGADPYGPLPPSAGRLCWGVQEFPLETQPDGMRRTCMVRKGSSRRFDSDGARLRGPPPPGGQRSSVRRRWQRTDVRAAHIRRSAHFSEGVIAA